MTDKRNSGEDLTRKWLAIGIVGISIAGIVVISGIAIALSGGTNRAETSRLVFSSVLPLLGTWVGTVLAFYFARENLQATATTLAIAAGVDTATPVAKVMIPAAQISAYELGAGERAQDIKLADVRARFSSMSPPARRLPIFDALGAVLYVVHDATLTAYAVLAGEPVTALTKTLGDMLDVAEYEALISAIGFVPEKATLAEARSVMASVQNCNDVFVTASGKRDEPVIGWLTNTLLAGVQ
jgi:hypothetical protein